MKFAFFATLLVLAACSTPQPSRSPASRTTGAPTASESRSPTPGAPATTESRTAPNTVSQDAAECERQAALSASAGSRAQAFNECMKARGRLPGR